jgi:hypothetical protein
MTYTASPNPDAALAKRADALDDRRRARLPDVRPGFLRWLNAGDGADQSKYSG